MFQVLIQVEAGSTSRNHYDEKTLKYMETRQVSQPYPYPYGFIIGTQAPDGDCVDCYIITSDKLTTGTRVNCEPVGLLVQDEDGETDHKVLAAIPGQNMVLGPDLLHQLEEFIYSVFSKYPDMEIRVGPILSREDALQYIQKSAIE